MKPLIKILTGLGVLLILLGAYQFWKSSHRSLSDPERIALALDGAARAIEDRSVARVEAALAPDFKWNESNRSEFRQLLTGAFWQARDIRLARTGDRTVVNGDSATTSGQFTATYKPAPEAPAETRSGNYEISWRKIDGEWKITTVRGGENIGP